MTQEKEQAMRMSDKAAETYISQEKESNVVETSNRSHQLN